MRDKQTSPALRMVWIKVQDANGRTHMEARWVSPDATPAIAHAA